MALIAEMRSDGSDDGLLALIDACDRVGEHLLGAPVDDRLAGSYPFLTMLSVAVAGWLIEREARAAGSEDTSFLRMKRAAARFYLEQIVPEANGLEAAATASSALLYEVDEDAFAA